MTVLDLAALRPLMALGLGAVVALLVIAIRRSHGVTAGITLLSLIVCGALLFDTLPLLPRSMPGMIVDHYAALCIGLFVAAAFVVTFLSFDYVGARSPFPEELYPLILLATCGALVLAASTHFVTFFLGLELLTVSLYPLIAYLRHRRTAIEAGLKYLVLAGSASALLLYGMALVYLQSGTLDFAGISRTLSAGRGGGLAIAGLTLIVAGVAFKLALVPFHMWTPEVYDAAPAPIAAFLATVSKGAVLVVVVRFVVGLPSSARPSLELGLALVAALSMIVGNLLALLQNNLKRILAYSSIGHMGYLLVALIAGGPLAIQSITFYLVAYFITMLSAFGVVTVLASEGEEADLLEHYHGLFWRRPGLAVVLAVSLLSLGGLPVTAGFVAKLYVLAAGVAASRWALVVILVLSSAIGIFYYLRVVARMAAGVQPMPADREMLPFGTRLLLTALLLLLVVVGLFPAPLQELAAFAAPGF